MSIDAANTASGFQYVRINFFLEIMRMARKSDQNRGGDAKSDIGVHAQTEKRAGEDIIIVFFRRAMPGKGNRKKKQGQAGAYWRERKFG